MGSCPLGERLTLYSFFGNIYGPIHAPITEIYLISDTSRIIQIHQKKLLKFTDILEKIFPNTWRNFETRVVFQSVYICACIQNGANTYFN